MSQRDALKGFFAEAQRLTERAANLKTEMAALRDAATKNGFDWSQIKALASAVTADEEAGDGKRLEKLLSKADFAAAYADMLGLRQNERKVETRSSESSGSDKAANHRPNRQGKTAPPTAPMVGADLGNGSGVDPDEQITESAVPPPDTPPRDGGAAAPAATDPRSTGIDGPVLPPPSPGTGPTNSDDPYNCIPPQFDRTRELRA